MAQENHRNIGRAPFCCVTLPVAVVLGLAGYFPLDAQQAPEPAVEGYITTVYLPNGFDVNGEHVTVTTNTAYGPIGAQTLLNDGPMRNEVEIGTWVQVFGDRDLRAKTVAARSVLVRDDRDRKVAGLGVIERVITAAPNLVFAADGYRILVTPATEISFHGNVKSLADVRTNLWVHYEGKLDKDGLLVADKAQFLPAKPATIKAVKGLEEADWQFDAPQSRLSGESGRQDGSQPPYDVSDQEAVLTKDGSVKFGPIGHTYRIPADQALQMRVRRIGMRLVPAYQKLLPVNDPSKIHFRFWAFDARKIRTEACSFDGLILIPMQLAARLKNDDQLAAVLADGVAFNLQRQRARIIEENRAVLGAEAATLAVQAFVPMVGLPYLIGSNYAASKDQEAMVEQRGRLALELMADAGYDPWQAPEAWRLAAPKELPMDTSKLNYPDQSGYQLGVLKLLYRKPTASQVEVGAPAAEGGVNGKP
jgi:Domain of unknown function (DUF5666)